MNPYLTVDGTEEEYDILFEEGQVLFQNVVHDLNALSKAFIHTKPGSKKGTYRRAQDYHEICIALAIYARKLEVGHELMAERELLDSKEH